MSLNILFNILHFPNAFSFKPVEHLLNTLASINLKQYTVIQSSFRKDEHLYSSIVSGDR